MEMANNSPTVWSDAVPRRSSRLQLVIPPMYQRSDEKVTETLPAAGDSNHDIVLGELESAATSFSQSSTAEVDEKAMADDDIWPRCSTDMMEFDHQVECTDDKMTYEAPLEVESVAVLAFEEQEYSQEDQDAEEYGAPGCGRQKSKPRRSVEWTTKLTLALINACIKFCVATHRKRMDVTSEDLDWDAWYDYITWPQGYLPRSKESCIVKIKKVYRWWQNPSGSLARVLRDALNTPPKVFGAGYRQEEEDEEGEEKPRPRRTTSALTRTIGTPHGITSKLEPNDLQPARARKDADDAAERDIVNETPVQNSTPLNVPPADTCIEGEESAIGHVTPLSARRRRIVAREPFNSDPPAAKRPKLCEVLQMLEQAASFANLEQEEARTRLHDLYRQRDELDETIRSAESEVEAKNMEYKRIDMMLRIGTPRDD